MSLWPLSNTIQLHLTVAIDPRIFRYFGINTSSPKKVTSVSLHTQVLFLPGVILEEGSEGENEEV